MAFKVHNEIIIYHPKSYSDISMSISEFGHEAWEKALSMPEGTDVVNSQQNFLPLLNFQFIRQFSHFFDESN